jgi:GntR family transcriptional regulator
MESQRDIDRSSYEPAYAQLARILREQVAGGLYQPGNRLPSEALLCKRYNVSPMTVRRAVNVLLDQGVVSTVKGKGTFVKSLDFSNFNFNLQNFHDLFKDKDRTRVHFLEVRIIRADQQIAAHIDLDVGQRVIFMRRLITRDGEPALYHQESMLYDPSKPIVEGEMELTALHGLFSGGSDTGFKKGKLAMKAMVLDTEDAKVIKAKPGDPAMRLEHIFYDFNDQPVSWGWFIFQDTLFELTTTVGIWE